MVKCESLRINMFRITHTGKSVNFPVTRHCIQYLLKTSGFPLFYLLYFKQLIYFLNIIFYLIFQILICRSTSAFQLLFLTIRCKFLNLQLVLNIFGHLCFLGGKLVDERLIFKNFLFLVNSISYDKTKVLTSTTFPNILNPNFSAQLRPNYLIASSKKGTFVDLERKVEPEKRPFVATQ